jgi:tryptophan-rich sensory protein
VFAFLALSLSFFMDIGVSMTTNSNTWPSKSGTPAGKTGNSMTTPPKYPWLGLVVWIVVCFVAAGIGGAVTTPNIGSWYAALAKPSWNPPNWIFGPVWSTLYFFMAIAAWLVWRQGGLISAKLPLALFGIQLILNVLWSCIFFGLQMPGLAFVEVFLLWAAIAATMVTFWQRSLVAGLLFVPYFAWVSFASVLNFTIWLLNS